MNKRRAGRKIAFLLAVFALGFFFVSNWIGHHGHSHAGGADCAVCHLGKLPVLIAPAAPSVAPDSIHNQEAQLREQSLACAGHWLALPGRAPPPLLSLA